MISMTQMFVSSCAVCGDKVRHEEGRVTLICPPCTERTFPAGGNAVDLLATDFPTPRWAVPNLLPEGLSLLVGAPKLGKSWLALNIAAAVAAGGRALGSISVDRGEVIYLALEDRGQRLKQRVQIVLEGEPPDPGLHLHYEWPLLHDGGADLLRTWLSYHPSCRLVVVDVFARVRGRTSEREDRYSADYAQMGHLKAVADEYGVAVLVVHHTRKAGAEDYLELVSGTNGLTGAADTILVLTRSRGAADAKLRVTGRDIDEAEHALNLTGGRWTLLDGPAALHEMGDTRRRILSLIAGTGPKTPKALAELLDIPHDLARQTCRRMADDHQLVGDAGTYSLPVTPVTQSQGETLTSDAVTGVTPTPWDDLDGAA